MKCKHEAKTRGLCRYCYGAANTAISMSKGAFTWEKLIAAGAALEAKPPTGRARVLTSDELIAKLKAAFPNGKIKTREEYIEAIGGNIKVLSKMHLGYLNTILPPDNKTNESTTN
jgi:hypothetical protein